MCLLFLASSGCKKPKPIIVGSKNTTEDIIVGEIIAQHLEHRLPHEKIVRRLAMGGALLAHEALLSGDVDLYPEYTGIAETAVLRINIIPDSEAVFERVRELYKTNLQLDWLDPLGYSSPMVMVVRKEDTEKGNLRTIGDAEKSLTAWSLGVTAEFQQLPMGLASLNQTYHLRMVVSPLVMDTNRLYLSLEKKQVNMISGNLTDARLDLSKEVALKDDRDAFPPMMPSIVVRMQSETLHPELRQMLLQLSGKFTQNNIKHLNQQVDIDKIPVAKVASEYLHFIGLKD